MRYLFRLSLFWLLLCYVSFIQANTLLQECTPQALQAALDQGGLIQFNCGQKRIALTEELIISRDTIIDGGGHQQGGLITLDGQQQTRVLRTHNSVNVELKNLTIINGKPSGDGSGAGLRIGNFSRVRLDHCVFKNNNGTSGLQEHGGGAIFIASLGELSVHRSLFEDNIGVNGGAINNLLSQLTVTDSLFINNDTSGGKAGASSSANGYGGAIYTDGASDNTTQQGGVIRIERSQFIGNRAAGQGGAVFSFVYPPDKVLISHSLFQDNHVIKDNKGDALGGGLRHGNGVLVLSHSVFIDNTAQAQGGALWIGEQSQNSKILNSTFYNNKAVENQDGSGGLAGAIMPIGGSLEISNTTIAGNHAGFVGGALFGGEDNVTFKNSLIVNNTAYNSGKNWQKNQNCAGSYRDGGFNIQFPAKNPNDSTDSNCTQKVQIIDPLLTELVQSDLPFLNLHVNSPAIGAGRQCEATDQLTAIRPENCTLGAVEKVTDIRSGVAYNLQNQLIETNAYFSPRIIKEGVELPHSNRIHGAVSLRMSIKVDSQHVGRPAAMMVVAIYTDAQQNTQQFMRQGQAWHVWDGTVASLLATPAELRETLAPQEHISIVEDVAFDVAGQLQVFVAYAVQIGDEVHLVFNGHRPLVANL
ncbi:hypothetical protein [Thioflexithrix psekupsensis]|uniref:Right handed beta helix domain-containing protein n=1 Tax=Thioflexithrix psekupsensis TaxID=1570016 RepID=A0A251X8G9_9GAMM|nr:hypothetical protein [Thioflexithrix psekupsensis]OUD14084.1 hypothetical protein TPSD3_07020 [Thioflexithrix psekupsensis]